ncbi:MAG: hypothetical protein WD690_07125 [Vicinamibacterales bacterium]
MRRKLRRPRRRCRTYIELGDLWTEAISLQLEIVLQRERDGAIRRQPQRRRLRLHLGARHAREDQHGD